MEYRRLGRCGLKVSELCLGTMTFGHGTGEHEAARMVDRCLDAGVNFFDTADTYGGGESEVMLGRALAGKRGSAIVATKVFNPTGPGANDSGASRAHIMRAVEESLARLKTDWIDLYYIHHVDADTPSQETLRTLDDLVRQGKVRYIGCSNYEAWRLADALATSEHSGLARFECFQAQYSLVVRDIEQEHVPLCQAKGLGIIAWSPLAGGFLSGKYHPGDQRLDGTRSAEGWVYPLRYFAPNAEEILAELLAVSDRLGRGAAEIALRWLVERPAVTSVIIGARTEEQLETNLGAANAEIDSEDLGVLSRVSQQRLLFPRSLEDTMVERRRAAMKTSEIGNGR